MMKVRPLKGQVLVQLLPPEDKTYGGIILPDIAHDVPHGTGQKAKPFKARVVALGPWKTAKNGFGILPEFGIGATVICTPYAGQKLTRNIGERLQLLRYDDVLAVVHPETS